MKKKMVILCMILAVCLSLGGVASASGTEEEQTPVYGSQLVDGEYPITITSSSSMFRIVAAQLNVTDGKMEVCMTLSGTGYEKLFMGTGEQALAADDSECIYYVEDSQGKYTYTVPIEALDQDTDCAAWSIRKQKWYDRVLVFESNELPKEAYAGKALSLPLVVAGGVVVVIVLVGVIVLVRRQKGKKS